MSAMAFAFPASLGGATRPAQSSPRRRRFQDSRFGLERDASRGDAVPNWKQASLKRMRQRARSRRQELVDKFRGLLKEKATRGSPNSQMTCMNRTLTEFRDELVRAEMAALTTPGAYRRGDADTAMQDRPDVRGESKEEDPIERQRVFGIQDVNLEDLRRSFVEFMEETFFKDLREEMRDIADARESEYLNWAVPNEAPVIFCPLCLAYEVGTCTVETEDGPLNVFACVCGAEFQPYNPDLRQRSGEDSRHHEDRLMEALKQRLGSFADFHSQRCVAAPVFSITTRRMLKVSCEKCRLNEMVV